MTKPVETIAEKLGYTVQRVKRITRHLTKVYPYDRKVQP